MSSEALVEGPNGVLGAWESSGQVRFARIDPSTGKLGTVVTPGGTPDNRKHPSLAVNGRGEALLAWTEKTGWNRGGDLVWQRFDAAGKPLGALERLAGGIPTWGLPAAAALPDGGFVLLH